MAKHTFRRKECQMLGHSSGKGAKAGWAAYLDWQVGSSAGPQA